VWSVGVFAVHTLIVTWFAVCRSRVVILKNREVGTRNLDVGNQKPRKSELRSRKSEVELEFCKTR